MTINDPVKFCESLWDWGCLNGCFGQTRIKPTDIDGFVERNGYYLFIETKLPGVAIPQGQMITFDALINNGCFTIMIVWGIPGKPSKIRVMTKKMEHPYEYENSDLDKLRELVSKWFEFADRQIPITV